MSLYFQTWCPGDKCDPCATGAIILAELHCSKSIITQVYVTGKSGSPRNRTLSLASFVTAIGAIPDYLFTYVSGKTYVGIFGSQPIVIGDPLDTDVALALTLNISGPGFSATFTGTGTPNCPTPAGKYDVLLPSKFTVTATISNGEFTNLIDEVNYVFPGLTDGLLGGFSYF